MKLLLSLALFTLCACASLSPTRVKVLDPINLSQNIYFAFDEWQVNPKYETLIREYSKQIIERKISLIILEGHADPTGDAAYNEILGDLRGRSVKVALVQAGLDPQRLIIISYGEERPPSPFLKYSDARRVSLRVAR